MSATADVRFGEDGATSIHSLVRLTGTTFVRCCTYEDHPPILAIQDGPVDITITNPGPGEVTGQDVTFGRALAEAAALYAVELEKIAARNRPAAAADEPGGQTP